MKHIDYPRINFDQILQYYSIQRAKHRGDEITFSCPFPEHKRGDRNPSANINTQTGLWHCFSCGRKGTFVNFVADLENISLPEAEKKVLQSYDRPLGQLQLAYYPFRQEVKEVKETIDEEDLKQFDVDWQRVANNPNAPDPLQYPFRRMLTTDTVMDHRLGYDIHSNRITIPYRDASHNVVGIKGRAIDPTEEPRYRALGDKEIVRYGFPTFRSVDYVYGLDKGKAKAVVVEGEFDRMWLYQNNFHAVSLSGSNPTMKQARLLYRHYDELIIMLDPDAAGERATYDLTKKIWQCGKGIKITIADLPIGKDPNDCHPDVLHEVIKNRTSKYPTRLLY